MKKYIIRHLVVTITSHNSLSTAQLHFMLTRSSVRCKGLCALQLQNMLMLLYQVIGSASLARSIRIRFHFRHRTGRIRSVSDHRAGRVWRSRHRSKTPNCLPGARDQVPALFRNAIERRGASVDSNSGAPITQSTFNMLRRMANLLSLLNWWLHRYDNEDDYALFQV